MIDMYRLNLQQICEGVLGGQRAPIWGCPPAYGRLRQSAARSKQTTRREAILLGALRVI